MGRVVNTRLIRVEGMYWFFMLRREGINGGKVGRSEGGKLECECGRVIELYSFRGYYVLM